MSQTKVDFGRRGALSVARPAAARPAAASVTAPISTPSAAALNPELAAIARSLMAEHAREQEETGTGRAGIVPWSLRAAVLAGLIASLLQVGMVIASAKGVVEIIPGLKVDIGQNSVMTPLLILTGLWSGARVAAMAVAASHFILKALGRTGALEYALGGAAAGAAGALAATLLTGAPHNIWAEAATGLAAGYFYRMFAGLRASDP